MQTIDFIKWAVVDTTVPSGKNPIIGPLWWTERQAHSAIEKLAPGKEARPFWSKLQTRYVAVQVIDHVSYFEDSDKKYPQLSGGNAGDTPPTGPAPYIPIPPYFGEAAEAVPIPLQTSPRMPEPIKCSARITHRRRKP